MPRILILSLVFPPDSVSTAEIMGDLAVHLRARGHDVSVLTTTPHYNRDPDAERRQPMRPFWGPLLRRSDYQGIPVYHAAMPAKSPSVPLRLLGWAWFHLVSTAAGIAFLPAADVLLVPSPPLSVGVSAWLVGALKGGRYVYNVQEIYPDIAVNLGALKNRTVIRLLERLERFVYDRAAAVTVIAPRMRQRLIEKGVPQDKVLVIPNFVDLERLPPAGRHNAFSRAHGLDDRVAVTYAGNMGPAQGLEIVIEAARLLADEPAVRILLAGEGSARAALTRAALELPQPNVTVLPYQPNALMPQIYGASDVCLVPQAGGIATDAIPSKVYRIMASARPLIAVTEEGSDLALLVAAAGCGAVVPPGDAARLAAAVRDAAARPEAWRLMGERGRGHVMSHYTRSAVGDEYHALVEDVARLAGPRGN